MPDTLVDIDILRNAVQLACRAPSLHNSQPWQWTNTDLGHYSPCSFAPPSESHVDCAAVKSLRRAARRLPARSTSWMVKYGTSVAAGVDVPMAATLPITRASMTRAITVSLSACRSGPLVGVSYLANRAISNGLQANGGSSRCCAGDCSWGHAPTSGAQVVVSARALLR
jgi:hypothetical protein